MPTSARSIELFGLKVPGLPAFDVSFRRNTLYGVTGSREQMHRFISALYGLSRNPIESTLTRRLRGKFHASLESSSGLLPAVHLSAFAAALPASLSFAHFMSISAPLVDALSAVARNRCERADCGLAKENEHAAVIRNVLASAQEESRIVVGAVLDVPAGSRQEREHRMRTLLRMLVRRGSSRLIVGERAFSLSDEDALMEEVLRVIEASGYCWTTFVRMIGSSAVTQNELLEAVAEAFAFGAKEVELLVIPRDCAPFRSGVVPTDAPRFFLSRAGMCGVCGAVVPPLDRAKVERDLFAGESDSDTVTARLGDIPLREFGRRPLSDLLSRLAPGEAQTRVSSRLSELSLLALESVPVSLKISELSSGERVRAAAAFLEHAGALDTLFLLDEISSILHPADLKLVSAWARRMTERGNVVIAAEDDRSFLSSCDAVLVLNDAPKILSAIDDRVPEIEAPSSPRTSFAPRVCTVRVDGFGFDVPIPVGGILSIVGRSGAGKSSFLSALEGAVRDGRRSPWKRFVRTGVRRTFAARKPLTVAERVGAIGVLAPFYAGLSASRRAGVSAEDFYLDRGSGRCDLCFGTGTVAVSRDVSEREICPDCGGRRYTGAVLDVSYRERTIADVLELCARDALPLFGAHAAIVTVLQELDSFGLADLPLGADVRTLDDSERQRVELVRMFLSSRRSGTLFILDQPFAGLSAEDSRRCMRRVREICNSGSSVVLSTHDQEVISASDFVLEIMGRSSARFFSSPLNFHLI